MHSRTREQTCATDSFTHMSAQLFPVGVQTGVQETLSKLKGTKAERHPGAPRVRVQSSCDFCILSAALDEVLV